MAQDAWPFNDREVQEAEWRKMARLFAPSGVLLGEGDELEVTERAAGAAMQVDVAAGNAWVLSHYFENTAVVELAIAAPAANPRIDTVVIRLDFVAGTRALAILQGAEAAVPAAPALTQNRTVKYELPLFDVYTRPGMVSVKNANDGVNGYVSTDRRTLVDPAAPWGGGGGDPLAAQVFG